MSERPGPSIERTFHARIRLDLLRMRCVQLAGSGTLPRLRVSGISFGRGSPSPSQGISIGRRSAFAEGNAPSWAAGALGPAPAARTPERPSLVL